MTDKPQPSTGAEESDRLKSILSAERAKFPHVGHNWPSSVSLDGEIFQVRYDISAEDEIEAFELVDSEGERLFGCEIAVIYLIEDHIWEIIDWEYGITIPRFSAREKQLYPKIHSAVANGKADSK